MNVVFILNDAPYGGERCYYALRLANALVKNDPQNSITVFLMADAVLAAKTGQQTPEGYLKERFARGEIDKEEFEERRRLLGE